MTVTDRIVDADVDGTFPRHLGTMVPWVNAHSPIAMDNMSRADRPKSSRVRRGLLAAAVVLAGGMALTSCVDDGPVAAEDVVSEDATVLDVNLGRFVLEPSALTAPAGDLQLRVTNVDPDLVHDLVVSGKGTRQLAPGESQTLNIPDVAVGEYRMLCDVPGHAEAGQTGTLVVTPATEPTATSA